MYFNSDNFTSNSVEIEPVTLKSLQKTIEYLSDRMPAAPSKLKMSAQTLDEVIHRLNAQPTELDTPSPFGMKLGSGMKIEIDHDMPFGEWEEWFDGAWRKPNPLG